MQKQPRPLLLFLITVTCFAAGLFSVWLRERDAGLGSGSASPTAVSIDPSGDDEPFSGPQVNVLFLGVDQLQSEKPELQAIWIASYRPPGDDLYLTGIPVDRVVRRNDTYADLFRWTAGSGPDGRFLQALAAQFPLSLDAVVLLDETAFAALIDLLGGIRLEGADLSGSQVLGVLNLLADRPSTLFATQARLLEALAVQAADIEVPPDLSRLWAMIPEHAYLSITPTEALSMAAPLLPITPDKLHLSLSAPE